MDGKEIHILPKFVLEEGHGWIYFLYMLNEIVYVGQTISKNPLQRISQHFTDKIFDGFAVSQVEIGVLSDTECDLIRTYNPKYNKRSTPISHLRSEVDLLASDSYLTLKDAITFLRILFLKQKKILSQKDISWLRKNLRSFCDDRGNDFYLKSEVFQRAPMLFAKMKEVCPPHLTTHRWRRVKGY